MDTKTRVDITAVVIYLIAIIVFVAFFLHVGFFEKTAVYNARKDVSHMSEIKATKTEVNHATDPAGMHDEYTWTFSKINDGEYLSFYIFSAETKVYFDGELIYSAQPDSNNSFCKNAGNMWVSIPLSDRDDNKDVKVLVAPITKMLFDTTPTFYVAAQDTVFRDCLSSEYIAILLSIICISLGMLIMITGGISQIKRKDIKVEVFYIGGISVMLGLWRFTETKSASFIFINDPLVLSYISVGMLFLITIPSLLFIKVKLTEFKYPILSVISIIISLAAIGAVVLEVLGIAEFMELRIVSYCILSLTLLLGIILSIKSAKEQDSWKKNRTFIYPVMIMAGFLLDILFSFKFGTTAEIRYLIIAFAIYAIIVFVRQVLVNDTKAYVDPQTGLFNKQRWHELLRQTLIGVSNVAIISLDINGLKFINDTKGHDAGDMVIIDMAEILKKVFPKNALICRWGGDEFFAMLIDVTEEDIKHYIENIKDAVEEHNKRTDRPQLHFATGYAIAPNTPDLNKEDLMEDADKAMYKNKISWYNEARAEMFRRENNLN